jgi:glutathione S-transferase
MALNYRPIKSIIPAEGLRLVLLKGYPSPWGQAAKAMMEYKDLPFIAGEMEAGQPKEKLKAWAGVDSAPVVAANSSPPINRWNDILLLLEELSPNKPLIPIEPDLRVQFWGIAHAICAEDGFGWNRRLDGLHRGAKVGFNPERFGKKYGYTTESGKKAEYKSVQFMRYLSGVLKRQREKGISYIVGNSVSAVDFYWAAFSNLVVLQSPEACPVDDSIRERFENVSSKVVEAFDPILRSHRDQIMSEYFKIPMEL